jgi:hypothetical protein
MNNHNTFDPKSRFITIDVSGMDDSVKEAVTILLIDIINMRLKTPSLEEFKKKRRTIITLDEGANLLKNKKMEEYIERLFREARAGKASIIFDTQDLSGIGSLLPVIKANTDIIFLMANMTPENVDEFAKQFRFTDKDKGILMRSNKGNTRMYLAIKGVTKIPGEVILTNKQKEIFLGEKSMISQTGDTVSDGYSIDERVQWIRDRYGFFMKEWITRMNDYDIPGYTARRMTNVFGAGTTTIWLRDDLINEDNKINGESYDHWMTSLAMAGEYCCNGFTMVEAHPHGDNGDDDADVTGISPYGERVWTEYERYKSHTPAQIAEKKRKQQPKCDVWMCVCQGKNYQTIKNEIGEAYCITRGEDLKNFIIKHGLKENRCITGEIKQTKVQIVSDPNGTVYNEVLCDDED